MSSFFIGILALQVELVELVVRLLRTQVVMPGGHVNIR